MNALLTPRNLMVGGGLGGLGLLPFIFPAAGQVGFALVTLGTTLPTWVVAKLGLILVSMVPEGQRPAATILLNRITYKCLNWSWWLSSKFSYWLSFQMTGIQDMRNGLNAAGGKPRCLLLNHLSFFDSILVTGLLPFHAISDMKTFAAGHVMKLPVVGTISTACGHLTVPFAGTKDGDFSVDKEAVAKVQKEMDEHVRAGGIGCWFPEGQLNSGDGTKLMQFRAGGFHLPSSVDCEIWCVCALGNAVMWPRKAAVGGIRAKIGLTCFRLCESSLSLVENVEATEGVPLERAKALHLANLAQNRFQEELDKHVAGGWCSVPKARKVDDTAKSK